MRRPVYIPALGDFVHLSFDPRVGHEQSGGRPALVLTSRAFNETTGYAFVAPVTTTARDWPFEVPIPPGGKVSGVVLTDQTRSLEFRARQTRFLARAPEQLLQTVLHRVGTILGLGRNVDPAR